jgi:hypothetical protein
MGGEIVSTQRCGNCKFFIPRDGPWESMCRFGLANIPVPVPPWIKYEIDSTRERGVEPDDGEDCGAWEARQ